MTVQWKMYFASLKSATQMALIAGAVAGDLTVTGINVEDRLISVFEYVGAGVAVTDVVDLTSEFTIVSLNTINNDGGTNTTGSKLGIVWATR